MSGGPRRRLFRLFDRPPSARDAVEIEISHHIEERARALMEEDGLSREQALEEAARRFGDLRGLRRRMEAGENRTRRTHRRGELVGQTLADLRFATRGLRRSPGLAAVVILTLTLGIGLNTAIFSVVKGVLLDPLPYPDADRLVWGVGSFSGNAQAAVSPPDYLDYRAGSTSFEYLGGRRGVGSYALTGFEQPEVVRGQQVTAEFFEALGGAPVLGRTFARADEEQVSRIVVLDHAFWQTRYGGNPDALGRTLTLDDESYEIVGVMPPGFQLFSPADFWLPIPMYTEGNLIRRFHNLRLVGKLRDGVSLEEAQAELDVIAARLEREYPESNTTWRLAITPLRDVFFGGVRPLLLTLWGAVGLVLLIVCANIANLLLARGAGRRSEIAVRAALGAGRGRIVRLLFAETFALAAIGCVAGIGLAAVTLRGFRAIDPGTLPRMDAVSMDGPVLAFGVAVALVTGILFGLLPALSAARLDLNQTIKTGGRGASGSGRVRGALVVAEVAMSFVLLIGAGLLLKTFASLAAVDPGFESRGALAGHLALPSARYETSEDRLRFFDRADEMLGAIPGVEGVAFGSILPLSGRGNDTYIGVPGRFELGSDQQLNAQFRFVSEDYFAVMEIPIEQGRTFGPEHREGGAGAVVIDRAFADLAFADEDPVGRQIAIDLGDPVVVEVIGVAGAVNGFTLAAGTPPHVYLPHRQFASDASVVIRTAVDPTSILPLVGPAIAEIDPLQPVRSLSTYREVVDRGFAQPRFQALLLGLFAAVALVLAVVGVYGVLSYQVAQRSREVGIRIALGARRFDVIRDVVRGGLTLTLAGLAIGALAAFGLTRFMSSLLFGVSATDAQTFAIVGALLAATSFLASYLPARRAAAVDATATLRQE
ncbi:MAG: ABC transporter permease [Gemmatimonadota bacterium]|nr:ABC transporter permease [Gemmatimonadota bacterium]